MKSSYTEYKFTVEPKNPATEILIAELAEIGFDTFEETETGMFAYIPTPQDKKDILEEVNILDSIVFDISYQKKIIEQQNWNEQWEKDFKPIEIDDRCNIRASFHPKKEVDFDIVINPKMSFGTGHHATTHLMLDFILKEDLTDKKVLDMGCGTGVLAILASMKNAKHVDAIDIDIWSVENARENIALNNCKNISVYEGDVELLKSETEKYDVIFANINRNILLEDMQAYAGRLTNRGTLLLSGFYEADLPLIKQEAKKYDLNYDSHCVRNDWTALKLLKN